MISVKAQCGEDDFIVVHDLGDFLVQRHLVSVVPDVPSLLASRRWNPPTATKEALDEAMRRVSSFASGLPVMLHLGAEGGSIVVSSRQSPPGFLIVLSDGNGSLLDDDDEAQVVRRVVHAEALADLFQQLDAWPWARLYPIEVDPRISVAILEAVQARLVLHSQQSQGHLERWETACASKCR